MTEYTVIRPLVRDRFYETGDTIMLNDDDAMGLLEVEPGIIIQSATLTERSARLTNQIVPWDAFEAQLDTMRSITIPVTEDGWMPPLRGGDHPDLQTLMAVASMLADDNEPGYVLELGTAYGNSACNLLEYAGKSILRLDTVCALPEQISGEVITKAFTREEIGRQLYNDKCLTFGEVRIIYQNTLNLTVEDLADEYKLCIIDACHDIDYVLNDIEVCLNVLAKDGVIMLHDVYPGSGPYQALPLHESATSGLIIRTLPGTWWAIAAWAPGWARLEKWMGAA